MFGMPMGPIELADTVGLDVCAHVGKILGNSADGSKLDELVKAGKLGKKSGEGFYVWKDGKPVKAEANFDKGELERLGRELVEPLIASAKSAGREHRRDADLVDAGVIFGTGFAPFRGGPLHFRAKTKSNVTPLRGAGASEGRVAAYSRGVGSPVSYIAGGKPREIVALRRHEQEIRGFDVTGLSFRLRSSQ